MAETSPSHEPGTERRILEAAGTVFVRKGKLGTSMQDIADEAGINRTLLHYYFRSKDKLFDTVFERIFVQLLPSVLSVLDSPVPLPLRLTMLVEAYTELLRKNPYLPVFVFQEISLNPERITDQIRSSGVDPLENLENLKKELEGAGLKDLDPRHIFADVMGLVLFPFIGRPIFQELAFQGDEQAYDDFLSERKKHIPEMIRTFFSASNTK